MQLTFRHSKFATILVIFWLSACAKTSPMHENPLANGGDGKTAEDIFITTFERHGGERLSSLKDINVAIDGEWHYLITKIQPDVTDETFRQRSEERFLLNPYAYAVIYTGDAGSKQVYRTKQNVSLAYNKQVNQDNRKQAAAALTADAFYLFTLGPLALVDRIQRWQRLSDETENGRSYYRINGELKPGIGLSDSDFITLWVDKNSGLTYRLHITLEGFDSTKGAHVDTTFLAYKKEGPFTFPTHFFERVSGPIRIDAHEWWYTGIDINRGLELRDLELLNWSEKAARPALPYDGKHTSN